MLILLQKRQTPEKELLDGKGGLGKKSERIRIERRWCAKKIGFGNKESLSVAIVIAKVNDS